MKKIEKCVFILFIVSLICGPLFAQNQDLPGAAQNTQTSAPEAQVQIPSKGKISLDIKGMDVIDVLKMVAQRSGLNIVVGKNVTGRVTLFLKDVEIWDAFEIIILANDLAYDKKADIINVMTQRDYELLYGERYKDKKQARIIPLKYSKAADLSRALNQIKTNVGRVVVDEGSNTIALIDTPNVLKEMEDFIKKTDLPLETRIFSLNYAQAEKVTPKIQEAITKGIGSIRFDERTNKIAVTDYPKKLDDIANVISAFDEKTPQVLIDSQIIAITPSDQFTMGVDWGYFIEKYFTLKSSLAIGTVGSLFLGTPTSSLSTPGSYKAILDVLRTIGDTKVLSSPRVTALNNQEAKIHVGTKEAYITSTTSQSGTSPNVTSQTVNFVDTGIQLRVTPTINHEGFVTMKIKPEISSAVYKDLKTEDQTTQIPIVTTSEAETTVTVKDGVTIIIGGLRKDSRDKTVKKIPIIGDIPGLGFLFRNTTDSVTVNELVILLTPHIISGEKSFTEFSEVPPKSGAVVKLDKGKFSKEIFTQPASDDPSAQLSLPTGDLSLADYYHLVSNRIDFFSRLNQPLGKKGEVKVNFNISSDGKLVGEPEADLATDEELKPFAVKAVKEAAPFPYFPNNLQKSKETFRVTIDYK